MASNYQLSVAKIIADNSLFDDEKLEIINNLPPPPEYKNPMEPLPDWRNTPDNIPDWKKTDNNLPKMNVEPLPVEKPENKINPKLQFQPRKGNVIGEEIKDVEPGDKIIGYDPRTDKYSVRRSDGSIYYIEANRKKQSGVK